jgi:hypothetical protein
MWPVGDLCGLFVKFDLQKGPRCLDALVITVLFFPFFFFSCSLLFHVFLMIWCRCAFVLHVA